MSNKLRAMMLATMGLAMLAGGPPIHSVIEAPTEGTHTPRPKKIVPRGCSEYFFHEGGEFTTDITLARLQMETITFKCFALNDKSAIRKFKNRHKL